MDEKTIKKVEETLKNNKRGVIFVNTEMMLLRGKKSEILSMIAMFLDKLKTMDFSKEEILHAVEVDFMTEEEREKETADKIEVLSEKLTKTLKDLLGELEDGNNK